MWIFFLLILISITGFGNIIKSTHWNQNGALIASYSKDKNLNIIDPRQNIITSKTTTEFGVRGMILNCLVIPKSDKRYLGARCLWIGDTSRILTVGNKRNHETRCYMWDHRKFEQPISVIKLSQSTLTLPLIDNDTRTLYFSGKGN